MYDLNALWFDCCNSVLTLILVTPSEIAFLICSVGIPLPPCNTIPIPAAFEISDNVSKLSDSQVEGYGP